MIQLLGKTLHFCYTGQWWIQDFPWGGRGLLRRLRFKNFVCRNERIWTLRGRAPGAPPRSANAGEILCISAYQQTCFYCLLLHQFLTLPNSLVYKVPPPIVNWKLKLNKHFLKFFVGPKSQRFLCPHAMMINLMMIKLLPKVSIHHCLPSAACMSDIWKVGACKQVIVQAREPPWLWTPGGGSHEVQNRGQSVAPQNGPWVRFDPMPPDRQANVLSTQPRRNTRRKFNNFWSDFLSANDWLGIN